MSKPIFIVRFPIEKKQGGFSFEKQGKWENFKKLLNEKLDDYHVITTFNEVKKIEFELYNTKDIHEKSVEELKELIRTL